MQLYLKKVVLILRDENLRECFLPLTEKLQRAGIVVENIEKLDCKECIKAVIGKKIRDSVLYITDSAEQARILNQKSLPVLGWLHESGDSLPGLSYVMECPEELDEQYLERVYRRFCNIPWDIVETERCLIRETTVEDVDAFYEIYSRPEIVEFMENLYPTREQEVAYTEEYIEKVYRYFEFGVWTVILRETGKVIGRVPERPRGI